MAFSVDARTADAAAVGLEAAWQAVQRVDTLMHPYRAGSDLAALNAAPVGAAVAVHAWTYEVLALSLALHRDSAGVFDPCLPEAPGRLTELQFLEGGRLRRRTDLRLDLGGIAKGFAVDRAVAALQCAGCTAGLVNAGGDLRVFGARAEYVDVGRAGHTGVRLENAALAASAPSVSAPPEHRGYYSRAAACARVAETAAIVAPTAAIADALTKCALFLPAGPLAALLGRHQAQLLSAA